MRASDIGTISPLSQIHSDINHPENLLIVSAFSRTVSVRSDQRSEQSELLAFGQISLTQPGSTHRPQHTLETPRAQPNNRPQYMLSTETSTPAWDEKLLKDPHAVADKRGRVQRMFAAIAPSYDLNNRLHSLWMDQRWRRRAVRISLVGSNDLVVDVACGTGDLTIAFADAIFDQNQEAQTPIGIDFTYAMLPIARRKADLRWINGDAQSLPLPDEFADVVSIAFGIRNVADPGAAIREFFRVLKPGGRLVILEFSLPTNPILRGIYNFYFRSILPRTATLISGDKTGAYKYLPESVNTFVGREQMMRMMRDAGFQRVEQFAMTFGVCVCYRGFKGGKVPTVADTSATTTDTLH
jgi:demethylmenaquinone methyltransferase/2-methoxy-6-polyprenyl-1,4-benzoquinol methylase